MKAVFLDSKGLDDQSFEPIQKLVDQFDVFLQTSPDQVAERIAGYDIVITNKVLLTAELLKASPTLKLICVSATGYNNIDMQQASEQGITVTNCVAYGVNAVVQHVFSLMLALHTSLPAYRRSVNEGAWQTSDMFCMLDFPITELAGKTLGIVGYGHLGQGVAKIARAFDMNILIAQVPGSSTLANDRVPMSQLLAESDVVTLHCPLTESTQDLIDQKALETMKSSAFLINAARGGVVNESALLNALDEGQIAGAATDVLTVEPPVNGNVLLEKVRDNLIVTPHCAWGSLEARQRIIGQIAENISSFQDGKLVREVKC